MQLPTWTFSLFPFFRRTFLARRLPSCGCSSVTLEVMLGVWSDLRVIAYETKPKNGTPDFDFLVCLLFYYTVDLKTQPNTLGRGAPATPRPPWRPQALS